MSVMRRVWVLVRGSTKTILALGFVLSIAVNILLFFSSAFATAASSIISTAMGIKTVFVHQADELAELSLDLDQEKAHESPASI